MRCEYLNDIQQWVEGIQFDFNSIKRRNRNEHKSESVDDIRISVFVHSIPF